MPNSCFPDYAQEGKNYLVLPALRFELELFSSRTGSSATISTHSTRQGRSWWAGCCLERENLNDSSDHPWNEFTSYSNQYLSVWTRWCSLYQLVQLRKSCRENNLKMLNWRIWFPRRMPWFSWGSFRGLDWFESRTDKIYRDFDERRLWSWQLNSLCQRFSLPG